MLRALVLTYLKYQQEEFSPISFFFLRFLVISLIPLFLSFFFFVELYHFGLIETLFFSCDLSLFTTVPFSWGNQ